jgi:hypothetical protein
MRSSRFTGMWRVHTTQRCDSGYRADCREACARGSAACSAPNATLTRGLSGQLHRYRRRGSIGTTLDDFTEPAATGHRSSTRPCTSWATWSAWLPDPNKESLPNPGRFIPHADEPPARPRHRVWLARVTERPAAAVPLRATHHPPPLRLHLDPNRPAPALGRRPGRQHALAAPHHPDLGRTQLRLRRRMRLRRTQRPPQRRRYHHHLRRGGRVADLRGSPRCSGPTSCPTAKSASMWPASR